MGRIGNASFSGVQALNASVLDTRTTVSDLAPKSRDDFKHSWFFIFITLGIGYAIVHAGDKAEDRRAEELKKGALSLYEKLDEVASQGVPSDNGTTYNETSFTVSMADDEQVRVNVAADGKLSVTMPGDERSYALDATVEGLRDKIAEDIMSNPTLFAKEDLRKLLPNVEADEAVQDRASVRDSFRRRIYMLAIKSRVPVGTHRLELVTTANLRDLADIALRDGKDSNVFGAFYTKLVEIETAGNAKRLYSHEATAIVESYRKRPAREQEKIVAPPDEKPPVADLDEDDGDEEEEETRLLELDGEMTEVEAQKPVEEVAPVVEVAPAEEVAPVEEVAPAGNQVGLTKEEKLNLLQDVQELMADIVQPIDPSQYDRDVDLPAGDEGQRQEKEKTLKANVVWKALGRNSATVAKLLANRELCNELLQDIPEGHPMQVYLFGLSMVLESLRTSDFCAQFKDEEEKLSEAGLKAKFEEPNYAQNDREFLAELAGLGDAFVMDMDDYLTEKLNELLPGAIAEPIEKPLDEMSIQEMMEDAVSSSESGGETKFVKSVLQNYFTRMPEEDRHAMAAALLRYGQVGDDPARAIGAALKGAGPLLHKLLQGAGCFTGEFAAVLKDVKKNLAPIPSEVVKAYLMDIKLRSGGKITSIEVKKVLGAASVGEAILCLVKGPGYPRAGKEVVVKMLRPDALARLNREKDVILGIARECDMEKSYAYQLEAIQEEFDFTDEAENLRIGEVYDKGSDRVRSVKAESLVGATNSVLIMEKAPGKTAVDVVEESKQERKRLLKLAESDGQKALEGLKKLYARLEKQHHDLCDLSTAWVSEGLFGGGVYHSDLHAGNVMLDEKKGLTLIDFGNVTKLSTHQQECITRIVAAACGHGEKEMVEAFINGLKDLLSEDERRRIENNAKLLEDIRGMLTIVLGAGDVFDVAQRVFVSLSRLQRMGVQVPGPIFKFSQSQIRLQNTVDAMNDELDSVKAALAKLPVRVATAGYDISEIPGRKSEYNLNGALAFVKAIRAESLAKTDERPQKVVETNQIYKESIDRCNSPDSQLLGKVKNDILNRSASLAKGLKIFAAAGAPGLRRLNADLEVLQLPEPWNSDAKIELILEQMSNQPNGVTFTEDEIKEARTMLRRLAESVDGVLTPDFISRKVRQWFMYGGKNVWQKMSNCLGEVLAPYRAAFNQYNQAKASISDQQLEQLARDYLKVEAETLKILHDNELKTIREFAKKSDPTTFLECMGKVVLQNIVTTMNRIDMNLVKFIP